MAEGQSTARLSEGVFGSLRGPPSAGQAEPRTSTPYVPHGGYKVVVDRMRAGRTFHRKRKRNRRSQAFIDPEDFVVRESMFRAMFEISFPAQALGKSPQGMRYTQQPVGSLHGLGTSPAAATAPSGPGRFQNVVDGPRVRRNVGWRKRHKKPSVAKMVRGVQARS